MRVIEGVRERMVKIADSLLGVVVVVALVVVVVVLVLIYGHDLFLSLIHS